ncbi:MAG TPA: hypothetical protein PKG69_04460, partial [Methanoregulaceae archaeon]|nr:hypothetical protein [Methanoregulaceae archaeon]
MKIPEAFSYKKRGKRHVPLYFPWFFCSDPDVLMCGLSSPYAIHTAPEEQPGDGSLTHWHAGKNLDPVFLHKTLGGPEVMGYLKNYMIPSKDTCIRDENTG